MMYKMFFKQLGEVGAHTPKPITLDEVDAKIIIHHLLNGDRFIEVPSINAIINTDSIECIRYKEYDKIN